MVAHIVVDDDVISCNQAAITAMLCQGKVSPPWYGPLGYGGQPYGASHQNCDCLLGVYLAHLMFKALGMLCKSGLCLRATSAVGCVICTDSLLALIASPFTQQR